MASHNQQQSTNPWIDWVGVVPFVMTDHILGQVRLGQAKLQTNPWVGGVLFIVTDHIQGYYMYCYAQAQKEVFEKVNYTEN